MSDRGLSQNTEHLQDYAELEALPGNGPEYVQLRSLTVDVTHECDFRCSGCIEGKAMNRSGRSVLTADSIKKHIYWFARQGGREILVYGGEPTNHRELPRILRDAAEKVEIVRVITNGANLNRRTVNEALRSASKNAKVTVRVSLNAGTSGTHAKIHRVKGYFYNIIDGMGLLTSGDSNVRLEVSYLVEEANYREIKLAFGKAGDAGAVAFSLRPKLGTHGIGLKSLSSAARASILADIKALDARKTGDRLKLGVEPWYVRYLETGELPNTAKPYPACYFCAASRLVVTPPDPGVVWSCTYWRGSPRFRVADLAKTPFGSEAFERSRIKAIRRVKPWRDCRTVICNRNEVNKAAWRHFRTLGATG